MSTRVASYRTAVLTTANQLTILRIIFVPVFIILLAYKEMGWALCTFVAAGVTDVLDGIIARRLRTENIDRRSARSSGGQAVDDGFNGDSLAAADGTSQCDSALADDCHHFSRCVHPARFTYHCVDGRLASFQADSIRKSQHCAASCHRPRRSLFELEIGDSFRN